MQEQFVTPNHVLSVFPAVLEMDFLNALVRPLSPLKLRFLFDGILKTILNRPTPYLGRILVGNLSRY